MPRRKQLHPLHLDSLDQLATLLEYADTCEGYCTRSPSSRPPSESNGEDGTAGDEHICGKCRLEFIDLSDFLHHKRVCTRKRLVLVVGDDSSDDLAAEGRSTSSLDFTDDPDKYGLSVPYLGPASYDKPDSPDSADLPPLLVGKTSQEMVGAAEDRPLELEGYSKLESSAMSTESFGSGTNKRGTLDSGTVSLPTTTLPQYILTQSLPDTNVTLQTLHNTRVAVAQQGVGANNVSQLAALHTALYTLQQQQIIQLQVIQQLQSQLVGSANIAAITAAASTHPVGPLTGTAALTPPQSADGNGAGVLALTTTAPSSLHTTESAASAQNLTSNNSSSSALSLTQSSTSVTESNNLVKPPPPPPPPPNEPNTLELLQRHTEQALQNTMAGSSFLLNGLSGIGNGSDILRFCKGKPELKRDNTDEAYFRHRCRFCGKVFGSDSALQIHIRSHTGERPFKCNVCGNRFSTKGNLKVHFQRHKDKYPHIKMNPHPVPLHLDNLHPPIEPPEASQTPPILGTGSSSQSIAPSLPPPNLLPSQPIALVTNPAEKDRESPTESSTQQPPDGVQSSESGLQMAPRSISPNEASNMSDESEGSVADGYASEDNATKEGDASRFDEEAMDHDDESFSSSPKPDMKEVDDKADGESKPLTTENGVMMTMSIVPSIPAHINTSAPTFPTFYHPSLSPSFSMAPMCFPAMSTPTLTITSSSRPPTNPNNSNNDCNDQMGLSPDPNVYQDLLPKPGSNDNSWESLMEVTKTSETSKLQQLVDNIEHKLSDPNQCVICHRVLSCKSALQMHYRTHTGERPFKCKICSRAFTTKGNLKTHMGVHRVKPPLRVLHQCPVCHKQFTNSLVLQQHIRMHTGEPTDMHPEQIMANEVRPSPLLATTFPRPLHPALISHYSSPPVLAPHPTPPVLSSSVCPTPQTSEVPPSSVSSGVPVETVIKTASKPKDSETTEEKEASPTPAPASRPSSVKTENSPTPQPTTVPEKTTSPVTSSTTTSANRSVSPGMDKPIVTTAPYSPSYTASLVALENHVKAINTTIPQTLPFSPFGMGLAMGGYLRYDDSTFSSRSQAKDMSVNRDKSPAPFPSYSPSPNTSRAGSDGSADERSTPGSMVKAESPVSVNGGLSNSSSGVITSKSESGALDLTPKTSVVPMPPSVTDMKLFPSPLSGLPFPAAPGRLCTTCRICFKTFACNSALEIHYRSHTKERPFKCNVCDRGFSTKGNMKQHMLTHKIRDLPPQLFTTTSVASTTNTESNSSTNASNRTSSPLSTTGESVNNDNKETSVAKVSRTPPSSVVPPSTVISPTITSTPVAAVVDALISRNTKPDSEGISKRSINEPCDGSSLPKRLPGFPKHFCTICQKPFSSASALQIHNRTHTGDKPFKCSICGRAFTTKGNLKVHMGTHMWNNGTSRRGRRMSLELPPLQLPPHGKHDFPPHVRPELYFPYMPPGYLNGMAGPPKMNEISVIQSATGITNGNLTTPSSMTLTPAVSMMTPTMSLSQQQPPLVRKVITQPSTDSDGVDDIDARSPDEAENLKVQHSPTRPVEISSPSPQTVSPSNNNNNSTSNTERSATWGWKIACNVCSKICSSSSDLEVHLKSHCNSSVKDSVRSAQQTAENIAS